MVRAIGKSKAMDTVLTGKMMTAADMDTAGQVVQHLRLPQFVQVLEVRRDGCDLPPRPFTTIRYDDELTLVGRPTVLSQCTAIKKGCARGKTNLP